MNNKLKIFILVSLLLLLGLAAYEPMRHNGFVDYDDEDYVTKNPQVLNGLSKEGIIWAFNDTDLTANWHPLTWLSHMLDVELFGVNPLGHHAVNLLLHLINALLLFWILNKTTGAVWPSFFVAAVFLLHPLRVESVAWASERKDVLSGFFWMLTILTYIYYAAKPNMFKYAVMLIFFVLGLMSKPMVVTMPFVLLLIDYWPLERFSFQSPSRWRLALELAAEKIPLFLLAAGSCVITYIAQQHAGAMLRGEQYSLLTRLSNSAAAFVGYVGKLFYPIKLAVLYPHPGTSLPVWQPLLAAAVLTALTTAVLFWGIQKRYLLVGWFWFGGTSVPIIGLVQVGSQAMADRYTYLPLIGLTVMIVWGFADCVKNLKYRNLWVGCTISASCISMIMLTQIQVTYWKDTISLFKHTLEVTKNNYIIHNNYASALLDNNDFASAQEQAEKSLQVKPDYVAAMNNLGMALRNQNKVDEAIVQWQKGIQFEPTNPKINANLGLTLAIAGRYQEAIPFLETILQIDPDFPNVHFVLGEVYSRTGNYDRACEYFRQAIEREPQNVAALNTLAMLHAQQGRIPQAIEYWNKVLVLSPADINTHINLGFANIQTAQYEDALRHYKAAFQIDPSRADILSQVAASYAVMGDYAQAAACSEKALNLAVNTGNSELISHIQQQVSAYRNRIK